MKCRKRKSGNGTTSRQWIYIFLNVPFILICKVGISGNVKARKKQVSDSAPGIAIPIFALKIRNAYGVEQIIHRGFEFLNVPFIGSGKSEWFWIVIIPFAVIIILSAALLRLFLYLSIVVMAFILLGWIDPGQMKEIIIHAWQFFRNIITR